MSAVPAVAEGLLPLLVRHGHLCLWLIDGDGGTIVVCIRNAKEGIA